MQHGRQIRKIAAVAMTAVFLIVIYVPSFAQSSSDNTSPSFVELYWKSSKTVSAQGVTNLIILDPEIAKAEVSDGSIQFFGLERGETVALGYRNDKPVSIRVRVIPRPDIVISPAMLRRQSEMAQGTVSSNVQVSDSNGLTTTSVLSGFTWSQLAGDDGHLNIATQVEDNDFAGGHAFNIRHGSIAYFNPGIQIQALDFIVSLTNNGPQRYLSPFAISDSVELRGAALTLNRGDNQYMFFGGTTIPFYYLTLGSTRDIGGFSFLRQQSEKLSLFATSSYINTPTTFLGLSGQRQNDFMQTGGFNYSLNSKWTLRATGSGSNHGGMGRGEVDYISHKIVFFAGGSISAPLFPLNQVFSLFSGTKAIKAGLTLNSSDRFSESVYYQHAETQAINNILRAGNSDYLNPSFAWRINRSQNLNFNYTYSRNTGGFANQTSTGNRFDSAWSYQFTPRVTNTAQFTIGSVQDPLQLNSEDQLAFRDGIVFPVKGGNMQISFSEERRNPSLVQKLNSELNLLSPALQNLFLQDPVSFVQSGNLPPDVKAILDAQVPINTSISASGQFRLGKKLSLSPNFSVARFNSGRGQSWTPFAGYMLTYQATRTLQFNSGLSNVWVLSNSLTPQRTTIFSFGFNKIFSAMPVSSLLPGIHSGHIIEGRVFRDTNLNGVFNVGEKGIMGIRVDLDNGDSTLTDELGRYRFSVGPGDHRVFLNLTQFGGPIRMTTQNEAQVDLIRQRLVVVDFGVVDFARLMGSVFNDLRFDGKRQFDAKGLPDVHLILDDGKRPRTIVAETNGNFEVDDVLPGDYKLSVDPNTLPPNYVLPADSFEVHVAPVSTVVQAIPARALRSISGRVFLKVSVDSAAPATDPGKLKIGGVPQSGVRSQRGGQAGGRINAGQGTRKAQQGPGGQAETGDYNLVPLAGIQLSAGYGIAISDEKGNFLLRDLPAGDLSVTVVPVKPLAPGMKVPSGTVHMPPDPIQVQGATIVISNPDLVPYLVGKTADEVREEALNGVSHAPASSSAEPKAASATEAPRIVAPESTKAEAAHEGAEDKTESVDNQRLAPPVLVVRSAPAAARNSSTLEEIAVPGSYDSRAVVQFTVKMAYCLMDHNCKGLEDGSFALSALPTDGSR